MLADENLTAYTNHVLLWHRYLDDVFVVWGVFESLLQFNNNDNNENRDFNLKFTTAYDQRKVTFLDVEFSGSDNSKTHIMASFIKALLVT